MAEPKLKLTPEASHFNRVMRNKFGWVPGSPPDTIPKAVLEQMMTVNAMRGASFGSSGVTEAEIRKSIRSIAEEMREARPLDTNIFEGLLKEGQLRRVLRLLFEQGIIEGADSEDDDELEARNERASSRMPQSMRAELKDIRGF
ncbi:hypothetical protein LCGC14_0421970 [marine sediment metagenome]|uniref:Uncharacterized protein n=1 Tax=marine sediment metagenome TaxID=412755 RepID=A0A0F9T8L3_9ZZZZ